MAIDNFPEDLNEWYCWWTNKYPETKKAVDHVAMAFNGSKWWFESFFGMKNPYLKKIPMLTNIVQLGWNQPPTSKWFPFKKNGGVDPLHDVQVFFQQLVTSIYPPVSRRIFWGINGKYTIRKKKTNMIMKE